MFALFLLRSQKAEKLLISERLQAAVAKVSVQQVE